jgi:hypothetical protein
VPHLGQRKIRKVGQGGGHSGHPERLVAFMHSKNESVAFRAAKALLDRGHGRPMQGVELSRQEQIHAPKLITVKFVEPSKRDDGYSVSQRPSLIGCSETK